MYDIFHRDALSDYFSTPQIVGLFHEHEDWSAWHASCSVFVLLEHIFAGLSSASSVHQLLPCIRRHSVTSAWQAALPGRMEPFPSPWEEPRRGIAVHDLLNHSSPPANHLNSHPHYLHHPQPQPTPPYALQQQGRQSSQLPPVLSPYQSRSPALADNHTESRYPPWQFTNLIPDPRPLIQGPGFPQPSIRAPVPSNCFAPSRHPDLAVPQLRHYPAEPLPDRRDICK